MSGTGVQPDTTVRVRDTNDLPVLPDPGMSAASMTLIGLVQPYLAVIFKPRDSEEEDAPTMKLMGTASFVYYTLICVFIHNVVYFSLEWFSFFEPLLWLLSIVGSTVLTVVLILIIEHYRKR